MLEERNPVLGDRGSTGNPGTQELWGYVTGTRLRSRLELGLRALCVEGADDRVVQVLESTDLFLTDTQLRLYGVPKVEDAGMNFSNVHRGVARVGT